MGDSLADCLIWQIIMGDSLADYLIWQIIMGDSLADYHVKDNLIDAMEDNMAEILRQLL